MSTSHGLEKESEIYLEQILDLLRAEYGYDCWIANGFIKEIYAVTPDDDLASEIETLAISAEGTLYYNVKFWEKHVDTPNKVIEVITHELLHKVFGDFAREYNGNRELHNIASDAVINATIYWMLGHADLMTAFYKAGAPEGILRPHSDAIERSKFKNVYGTLYGHYRSEDPSVADVFAALKTIMPKKTKKITFIGDHKEKEGEGEDNPAIDAGIKADDMSKVAIDIAKKCKEAGVNNSLLDSVISILHTRTNMRNSLLKDFSINKNINRITNYIKDRRIVSSVFPINPSRRDIAMLASGIVPVLWRNQVKDDKKKNQGVAVYVDVSGSMHTILPKVLSVISSLRKNINKVFQFSNKVSEASLEDTSKGKIKSTGGTDFDCIVEHAVKNEYSKIIVISDGYAGITPDNEAKCKANIEKACMILIAKSDNKDNFISNHYDQTYYLDDLC